MTADRASPQLSLLGRARRYRGFVSSDGRVRGAAAAVNRPRMADELLAAVVTAYRFLIARIANVGRRHARLAGQPLPLVALERT